MARSKDEWEVGTDVNNREVMMPLTSSVGKRFKDPLFMKWPLPI